MTDQNTAIDRIRKLMALTVERGASEAEAALASEHVQRILAEHNLSMAAVEATGMASAPGGKRVREEGVGSRQVYKWQRTLMNAIAELNYCKAFQRMKEQRGKASIFDGYDLIGRVDNVSTTRHMFDYLLQTIERLARDEVKDPTQFFTRYAHSFKEGCADRLVERLQDKQRQIVEEHERAAKEASRHPGAASSNLPAVILSDFIQTEKDLNNDLIKGWTPGTTAQNRRDQEEESQRHARIREDKFFQAIARGLNEQEAQYVSWGYSDDRARDLARPEPVKPQIPETDAQRRKRQERKQRDNDRFWGRQHRAAQRLDRRGYDKGQSAGENVSLNRQVDGNGQGKLS